MMLRPNHPDAPKPAGTPQDCPAQASRDQLPRLNLLLTCASWRQNTALDHLPPLLEPLGIRTIKAPSGEEAAEIIQQLRVHIAVVDLAIPLQRKPSDGSCELNNHLTEAGPRVLQLLRRLDAPPPTVVVRPPQPATRESARSLMHALREGAFAVLDQPVNLESMLEVLRRIVRRHYSDAWPA
jgi:CheY-like chemotaxis protein